METATKTLPAPSTFGPVEAVLVVRHANGKISIVEMDDVTVTDEMLGNGSRFTLNHPGWNRLSGYSRDHEHAEQIWDSAKSLSRREGNR